MTGFNGVLSFSKQAIVGYGLHTKSLQTKEYNRNGLVAKTQTIYSILALVIAKAVASRTRTEDENLALAPLSLASGSGTFLSSHSFLSLHKSPLKSFLVVTGAILSVNLIASSLLRCSSKTVLRASFSSL